MIGDSLPADIQGGQNAGLAATVWVNRGGGVRPPEVPPAPSQASGSALYVAGLGRGRLWPISDRLGIWRRLLSCIGCLPLARRCGTGRRRSVAANISVSS
jgi:hypothetical protein